MSPDRHNPGRGSIFDPNLTCGAGHQHQAPNPEAWVGQTCERVVDLKGRRCQEKLVHTPEAHHDERLR